MQKSVKSTSPTFLPFYQRLKKLLDWYGVKLNTRKVGSDKDAVIDLIDDETGEYVSTLDKTYLF